jgi:hypothetical protein
LSLSEKFILEQGTLQRGSTNDQFIYFEVAVSTTLATRETGQGISISVFPSPSMYDCKIEFLQLL